MRIEAPPSRRARVALLTAALGLLPLLAACSQITGTAANEKEDLETKKQHYEEAAQTYYDGGKYAQAVVQWRRLLELEPDRPKANWGLAKSLQMVGTVQALRESISIYERIIGWDWTHPTLGDRRHEIMKDFAEAYSGLADYYDEDVRALQDAKNAANADLATLNRQIAEQTAKRNELLQKAIPLYQGALERSPDNPYCIAGLAKAYLQSGNDAQGIQYARRYIQISERSQQDWDQQLKMFEKEHGDASEEQRNYFKDKVRAAREKELKVRLLLGSVLVRNHDYYGAIKEYSRVIELDPARPAAFVERGQAYGLAGDYRKAVEDLDHYLKITDPVKQRQARISAAELLEKYRLEAARQAAPTPAPAPMQATPPPPPPPPPAPQPIRR